MTAPKPNTVKRYNTVKLTVSLFGGTVSFIFIIWLIASGTSLRIEQFVSSVTEFRYAALLLFVAIVGASNMAVSLPFNVYTGFILEHRYQLSNQTLPQWLWEGFKGLLVSIPIAVPVILLSYFLLLTFHEHWWLPVGFVLFVFSIGLTRIAPIIILPLFYKLTPLEETPLKEKILSLTNSTAMRVEGIYSFDLSKTTKKANAAFTGIGRSKRILLGDTLIKNFSDEEIETVFAHELGHYTRGHIRKGIAAGTITIFLGLYLTSLAYSASIGLFGFASIEQLAALPLLTAWLGVYSLITSPIGNMLSRKHEFEADRFAVEQTKNRTAFVSTMNKLAEMNLADKQPNRIVEFLFHSHPSIEKRIRAIEGIA